MFTTDRADQVKAVKELVERIPDSEIPRLIRAFDLASRTEGRRIEPLFPMDHVPHTNC